MAHNRAASPTPTVCDNFTDLGLPAPSEQARLDAEKGLPVAKEDLIVDEDDAPPDGGYGWVVAICQFFCNGECGQRFCLDAGLTRTCTATTFGVVGEQLGAMGDGQSYLTCECFAGSFGVYLSFYRKSNCASISLDAWVLELTVIGQSFPEQQISNMLSLEG